jgi:hypothetical protein
MPGRPATIPAADYALLGELVDAALTKPGFCDPRCAADFYPPARLLLAACRARARLTLDGVTLACEILELAADEGIMPAGREGAVNGLHHRLCQLRQANASACAACGHPICRRRLGRGPWVHADPDRDGAHRAAWQPDAANWWLIWSPGAEPAGPYPEAEARDLLRAHRARFPDARTKRGTPEHGLEWAYPPWAFERPQQPR